MFQRKLAYLSMNAIKQVTIFKKLSHVMTDILDSGCVNTITCTIKVSGLKEGELLCGYETTLRLLLFELHTGSRVNFEMLFLLCHLSPSPLRSF